MEMLQQIGSYAGLAAVPGLAVLAALYFSQARDVKRLREWAARAPDRFPEPVPAARVSARPVPRAPGQTLPAAPPASPAVTAAAGAAPATAVGPAAATPAAARAAEAARTDDADGDEETDAPQEPPSGGTLSQDTVVHPPPAPREAEDEQEEEGDDDLLEQEQADETGDYDAVPDVRDDDFEDDDSEEWDPPSGGADETGDHPVAPPEEHWQDTGDEPAAVPTSPPLTPAPSLPSRPAPAAAAGASPSLPILPPYAESRPGAPARRGGLFSSRGRGIGVVAAAVLVLAVIAFAATRVLGGNDSSPSNAGSKGVASTTTADGSKTTTTSSQAKRKGVAPSSVRVAVLNGTTVPGLAAQIGDSIEKQGFKVGTVTNFNDQQRAESVVLYAPGAEREAAEVGRRLKISQREPIDPESQSVAGDATVVVITGRDKTQ